MEILGRLGSHPAMRSDEKDRSLSNATCPEVLEVSDPNHMAFMGSEISPEELLALVKPEDRRRAEERLRTLGAGTIVSLTRSTVKDAKGEILDWLKQDQQSA